MEEEKEKKNEAICMKYQEEQSLEEGCKHPKDYCPYRQSCLIYFYSKEKSRDQEK